jgi:hypothetical protein
MKVFLAFYLVLAGDPNPLQGHIVVPSLKECHDELGKLAKQPLPDNWTSAQYSCVVHKAGDPA